MAPAMLNMPSLRVAKNTLAVVNMRVSATPLSDLGSFWPADSESGVTEDVRGPSYVQPSATAPFRGLPQATGSAGGPDCNLLEACYRNSMLR
jgi:hypothetical protein